MGERSFVVWENDDDNEIFDPVSPSSSSSSSNSSCSTSSVLADDGSDDGPLFGLSSLMSCLPAKRGLSCYFSGKSQSFSSLSSVRSVEDLAKKEIPLKRKMKPSKSYGGVADLLAPSPNKKTISKKNSRFSCASLANRRSLSGAFSPPKPPLVPLHKNN